MTTYRVAWFIDIEADSPEAAAEEALSIQRDSESCATVFTVQGPNGAICYDPVEKAALPSDFSGYWARAGE